MATKLSSLLGGNFRGLTGATGATGSTGATGATGAQGVTPRGVWSNSTAYVVNDLALYSGSTYRRIVAGTTSNNPSVDSTNWELFAQSGIAPTAVVLDSLTNSFNGRKTIFDLNFNRTSVSIAQVQDLQVAIDGKILIPDTSVSSTSYPWLVVSSFGSIGKGYRIKDNKLVLYNAPMAGQSSYLLYRQTQTSTSTVERYPFAATIIALGD